ncbi:MAG: hypothetical protein ACRD1X_03230 [Vicinamibacteria bacterium]
MSGRAWGYKLVGLMLFLGGCAGAMATEPPPGAVKVEREFPAPGTKWVTRSTDHTGATTTTTLTALGEDTYGGKPVYRFDDGVDIWVYDKATHSWIARVRRDGQERIAAQPHDGSGSSPLWVGKSWQARYAYYDRDRGRSFSDVTFWWTIAAYEEVTVPAGTFKAFRLEGSNPTTTITSWWAPEFRVMVKRIFERNASSYLGPGKFTTELVEYQPVKDGEKK